MHDIRISDDRAYCSCGWSKLMRTPSSLQYLAEKHADKNRPALITDHRFMGPKEKFR